MTQQKKTFIFMLLVLLIQACNMQVTADATATPVARKTALPTPTRIRPTPTQIVATATLLALPSATPAPQVTVTALKGNLFIRRGPDLAYNPVGVLYKGTTVKAFMRDTLSKWVQVVIPKSDKTGWVSLMTEYSKVEGDAGILPQFKITEWPLPSYVRNCSKHRLFLVPGNIYVESVFGEPENLVWVYPGHYRVFDIDIDTTASIPVEIDSIDTREGVTVDISYDGTGERHKCE